MASGALIPAPGGISLSLGYQGRLADTIAKLECQGRSDRAAELRERAQREFGLTLKIVVTPATKAPGTFINGPAPTSPDDLIAPAVTKPFNR